MTTINRSTAGSVNIEFFKLQANGQAEKRAESPAVFRSVGGESRGIWVAPASFPETGNWGAQVTLDSGAGSPRVARMNFPVQDKFSAPGYDRAGASLGVTHRSGRWRRHVAHLQQLATVRSARHQHCQCAAAGRQAARGAVCDTRLVYQRDVCT